MTAKEDKDLGGVQEEQGMAASELSPEGQGDTGLHGRQEHCSRQGHVQHMVFQGPERGLVWMGAGNLGENSAEGRAPTLRTTPPAVFRPLL